jgi:hypothetical protein
LISFDARTVELKLLIYTLLELLGVKEPGSNLISIEYPSFQRVHSLNQSSVIVPR